MLAGFNQVLHSCVINLLHKVEQYVISERNIYLFIMKENHVQ